MKIKIISYSLISLLLLSCNSNGQTKQIDTESKKGKSVAIFAEGCFWCSEHIFESVVGVKEAISGYTGGRTKNPTYQQVGGHTTGHAEAVLVYYDPKIISYKELVNVFYASHDPTTPDRQGPDVGDSYRSIAFYKNIKEKLIIEEVIKELTKKGTFKKPIITEIKPVTAFYKAEDYHQNYIKNNPYNQYVENVSIPRYKNFKKKYKGKLKFNS